MRSAVPAVVALLAALSLTAEPPKAPEKPFSKRNGQVISVQPAGPTFTIPADWVEWQQRSGNALHITRKELDGVKEGAGEWDTEYAELVNATLDFDACAFAGGGEGWGKDSVSFADLQMRMYILEDGPEAIEKVLDDAGAKALRTIMGPDRIDERNSHDGDSGEKRAPAAPGKEEPLDRFKPVRDVTGSWRKSVFAFDLRYGDYGATAHVDYRIRAFEGSTVVAVFMYTNYEDQAASIKAILDSVSWPDAPRKPK